VKKILALTFLLAVCTFFLAYYLGKNWESVAQSSARRVSWKQARFRLKSGLTEQLGAALEGKDVAVPRAVLERAADCMTGKAIRFLDDTSCKLTYLPSDKSEQKHLDEQAGCLKRSGYQDELEDFMLQCLRTELPDDWKMVAPAMAKEMAQRLFEAGIPDAEAEVQGACYANMAAVALNESGCPLIDRRAARLEGLIGDPEDCTGQADMKSELFRFMRVCTEGRYPAAAGGSQAGTEADRTRGAEALDSSAYLQGIVPLEEDQCPLDYHRREELCLHSELLSLEPPLLESIIRSYKRGGPVPAVKRK
jgi:hypothetical protein